MLVIIDLVIITRAVCGPGTKDEKIAQLLYYNVKTICLENFSYELVIS